MLRCFLTGADTNCLILPTSFLVLFVASINNSATWVYENPPTASAAGGADTGASKAAAGVGCNGKFASTQLILFFWSCQLNQPSSHSPWISLSPLS